MPPDRYPPLSDGVPVGLYRNTRDGRIREANDTLVTLLAYPDRESLLRANAASFYVDAQDREKLLAVVDSRGQAQHYGTRLRRHDGRTIHVEISVRKRVAEDGTPVYEGAITDITERRVAEEALWESERRLRLVVEQVPAVLWSVDRDLRFTLSLGGGLAALGLKPRQVVGQTIFEYFQTEDRSYPPVAAHLRALRGESSEYAATWANKTFDSYVEPLRDESGTITGVLGVALDVTERNRVEQELREGEARYRHLVDSVKAVVWRGDPCSFRFSFVSPEAETLLGYPAARWTEDPRFWIEHIHPEDREEVLARCQEATRALKPHDLQYRMIAADGRIVWLHDIVRLIVEQGVARESVGLMVDITEQRREQALRTALYRVGERVGSAGSMAELYAGIHGIIRELMPARNFYIALYDEDRDRLEFPYFVDEVDAPPAPKQAGRGLTEYVLRTGRPLLATSATFDDLRSKGEAELVGADSLDWLGVPLQIGQRTLGVMAVQTYSPVVRYTDREKDILAVVSQQVAAAIDRKRSEEDLKQTLSLLRSTLESTSDGILVVDLEGHVVLFNQRFIELWRIPTRTAMSGDDATLLADVVDQLRDSTGFLAGVQALYAQPEKEARDVLEFKDGRLYERHSIPQWRDGRPVGRVWSFRDVSDRPRSAIGR
jgi:PAS domain S-box-containing protein